MTATQTTVAASQGADIARLDELSSQAVFDVLLRTLSRPGTVATLPSHLARPQRPPALILPLALADQSQSVAVIRGDDDDRWSRVVCDATGARRSVLEAAQLVVALVSPTTSEVLALRRGRSDAPEDAARLALRCTSLTPASGNGPLEAPSLVVPSSLDDPRRRCVVEVQGPGVPGRRRVAIEGLDPEVLEAVALANGAFPLGIDVWLFGDDLTVSALARSSILRVAGPPPAESQPGAH